MTSATFKRNAKRIKDAIAAKTEPKQNTSIGGAVGSTKLFIGGQIFQGSITGTQEVVNAGRPAAARYVAKNGGGTTIISSSGTSVTTGGGGGDTGGGYLPLSGIYPMTGSLDMGENSIINVQMVDGRDLQADGALLDGLKNADVITLSANANFVNERVLTFGTGFTVDDGGAGNPFTVTIPTPPTLSVSSVSSGITRSHAITTSNAPGAAASILASSASGVLTLPQFIATTKVTTPLIDTASGDLSLAPVGDVVTLKNVGIGATPSLPLDVSKTGTSVTIDGVTDYEDIIGARNSGGRGLRLGSNDTASYIRTSFSGTDLILATRVAPDNIERVRVKSTGNVLIGTSTDDGYKLDVSGTMRATTSLTTPLITTATNTDLVINPAGTGAVQFPNDQKLRTSSFDSSFPINGWQINEVEGISGYSALTIGKIQADELAVRVFVADEVRVDRGDEFWTKSYGIVAETFTTPTSIGGTVSVMFEDSPALTGAIFVNDDWVLFRKLEIDLGLDLFNVWGQVSSYVDNGDGTQNWTFTLRSGPTDGKDITKGSLAIDFGASGAALIHLSVIDAAGAPYIKMRKWVTNPYTPANFKTYVQLGNLGSIGNSYVTPAGYGIYIGSTAGDERFLLADDNGLQIRGASLALYDGANQTVQMSYTGDDVWFGSSASDKRFQWDGDSLKINNSSGAAVIQLDNDGSSYFAGVMTIGTSGEVRQGTGALGVDYTGLRIWRDTNVGRIAGYNTDVQQWYANTDGKLYAGAGKVWMDASGVSFAIESATTSPSYIRFYNTAGSSVTGSIGYFYVNGTIPGVNDGMIFYANSGHKFRFLNSYLAEFENAVDVGTFLNVGTDIDLGGDIIMAATKTVDGVDISAFKTAYDSHDHSSLYLALSGGTLTGTLTSRQVAPSADNTYKSGTATNRWSELHVANLYVDTIVGTPSYSHTHSASDITSGTLDAARIPDNYVLTAGDTMSGALVMDADTGVTSNYIRFLTQTSTGKAWDLIGRAHDYATSAQQNDLLLTYYDGSTIYVALQFDSGTRIADFLNTPTVGGTTVSLSTHDHSGVYVPVARTVTAGSGLTGGGALSSNITISHDDTSSQASVNNSDYIFVQDVTLDGMGHVTGLASVDAETMLSGYLKADGSVTGSTSGVQVFTNGVKTARLSPITDGTTALLIRKASDNTALMTFDTTNGWFGIGGTPGLPLDITKAGVSATIDAGSDYEDVMGFRNANGRGLRVGANDTVAYFRTTYNGNDFAIATRAGGVNYERMRVKSTGNVLIGTTTDSGYKLDVAGTGRFTSDLSVDGELLLVNGSSAAPTLTNQTDTNTGIYWSAADTLAFTTGGTQRGTFSSSGLGVTGSATVSTSVIVPTVTTASGNLSLTSTGGTVAVTGALTVSATATMTSNVTSPDYASQTTGWRIDSQGGADFRYMYTDQLHAKAFIADLEQALAGGQIITKSVTILHSAFVAPMAGQAATLKVKDLPSAPGMQVFQSGDIVRLRTFDRSGGGLSIADCWGVVTSPSDNADGTQNWTFTRSGTATYSTIAHRDTQTRTQSSSTTNVLTKPTGTASGDCLIASIAYVGTRDVVPPVGWELIRAQAGTNITLAIYQRTAGGSEGSNYTFTFNVSGVATATNSAAAISGYTNCYVLRTVDTSNSQWNTSSTSMYAPTVSPGSTAGMLLFVGGISDNTRATPPASMTERADAGSSNAAIYVADQLLASNSATGTKTATLASSETTAAALVVLMPNYTAMSTEAGAMIPYSTVEPDAIVLDYGTTGNGFHEVNAIDGVYAANSPYAQVVTWTTHPATGSAVRTRTGNLRGLWGEANEYGFYAGDGTTSADKYLRLSTSASSGFNNIPIAMYSSGTKIINIDTASGVSLLNYATTIDTDIIPELYGLTWYKDTIGTTRVASISSRYRTSGQPGAKLEISTFGTPGGTPYPSKISIYAYRDEDDAESDRVGAAKIDLKSISSGSPSEVAVAAGYISVTSNTSLILEGGHGSTPTTITLASSLITVDGDIDMNGNDITDVATIASKSQTISPSSTGDTGITVNMPTSTTSNAAIFAYNSTPRIYIQALPADNRINIAAFSNGTSGGSNIILGNNNNGSTPASGYIGIYNRSGTLLYLWTDATNTFRIHNVLPNSANDTSGTVVGTQTSSLASKNVLGEFTDYSGALQAIVDAPLYDFTYKSGAFNGEQFTGIITDYAPTFGMDGGKSLNEITAHGYSMAAIKALHGKIQALEAQVAELQNR